MRLIFTLTVLLLVICVPVTARAEGLEPVLEYKYYDVNVKDDAGIVDEAFKATPIRQGGHKFLGEASCATGYTYNSGQKGTSAG